MIERLKDVQSLDLQGLLAEVDHLLSAITSLSTTQAPVISTFPMSMSDALLIVVDLFADELLSPTQGSECTQEMMLYMRMRPREPERESSERLRRPGRGQ